MKAAKQCLGLALIFALVDTANADQTVLNSLQAEIVAFGGEIYDRPYFNRREGYDWAQQFTVGKSASLVRVSVSISFEPASSEPPIIVTLHADSSGLPGSLVTRLRGSDSGVGTRERERVFVPESAVQLAAGTQYWLVVGTVHSAPDKSFTWNVASDMWPLPAPAPGWGFAKTASLRFVAGIAKPWWPENQSSSPFMMSVVIAGSGSSPPDDPTPPALFGRIRVAALTGRQAPGLLQGTEFVSFPSVAVLNGHGSVAFEAILTARSFSGGSEPMSGIWSEDNGVLTSVALQGDPAPGTSPGVEFEFTGNGLREGAMVLNDGGQILFPATVRGPSVDNTNRRGVWLWHQGTLTLLRRDKNPAPGLPAGTVFNYGSVSLPGALGQSGHAAFFEHLTGPGILEASAETLWVGQTARLTLVARTGGPDAKPWLGPSLVHFPWERCVVNGRGETAFICTTPDFRWSVWRSRDNGVVRITGAGDVATGAGNATTFGGRRVQDCSELCFNNRGEVAFLGGFEGPAVNSETGTGVFVASLDGVRMVARSGDAAVGEGLNGRFDLEMVSGLGLTMNGAGRVAFRSGLRGLGIVATNDSAIVSDRQGILRFVAREGQKAPDLPSGTVFDSLAGDFDAVPAINFGGQVAFSANFITPGKSERGRGLWAQDRRGALRLVVATGGRIEIAPGDLREVTDLSFQGGSGNQDGRASAFNDLGQVAFVATFADGSEAVLVSDRVALTEAERPSLSVRQGKDGSLQVRWPAGLPGFRLEFAETLPAGTVWNPVTDSPSREASEFLLQLSNSATSRFYRLGSTEN